MIIGEYEFHCRLRNRAQLPLFKGSCLRGALGHALLKITCALRRQSCEACILAVSCPYSYLFEVHSMQGPNMPVNHRPHPYSIVPAPDDRRTRFAPGDTFSFRILLFGKGNDYLPHVTMAVQSMGETGLGQRGSDSGRFVLERVLSRGKQVFDGRTLAVSRALPDEIVLEPAAAPAGRIVIRFHTPLRVKHGRTLQNDLPFHVLVRAALRRISGLETAYGSGEPALDYRRLVHEAREVRCRNIDARWIDIPRYSNRQKTKMMIGGVVGSFEYSGAGLEQYLPLLRYCRKTGLGKQTSFGLGRYTLESS